MSFSEDVWYLHVSVSISSSDGVSDKKGRPMSSGSHSPDFLYSLLVWSPVPLYIVSRNLSPLFPVVVVAQVDLFAEQLAKKRPDREPLLAEGFVVDE